MVPRLGRPAALTPTVAQRSCQGRRCSRKMSTPRAPATRAPTTLTHIGITRSTRVTCQPNTSRNTCAAATVSRTIAAVVVNGFTLVSFGKLRMAPVRSQRHDLSRPPILQCMDGINKLYDVTESYVGPASWFRSARRNCTGSSPRSSTSTSAEPTITPST